VRPVVRVFVRAHDRSRRGASADVVGVHYRRCVRVWGGAVHRVWGSGRPQCADKEGTRSMFTNEDCTSHSEGEREARGGGGKASLRHHTTEAQHTADMGRQIVARVFWCKENGTTRHLTMHTPWIVRQGWIDESPARGMLQHLQHATKVRCHALSPACKLNKVHTCSIPPAPAFPSC
jgi:hypothetical protein